MLIMKRTLILAAAGVLGFTFVVRGQMRQGRAAANFPTFRIVEATISQMQAAMAAKRLTSREIERQVFVPRAC